ncbi:10390_t:CDS:2, partial [Gigaspora margarita]
AVVDLNKIGLGCNINMQLDDMDESNLLIEEIINLSNPAFVDNNNSFIGKSNFVISHNTQWVKIFGLDHIQVFVFNIAIRGITCGLDTKAAPVVLFSVPPYIIMSPFCADEK